MARGDVYRFGGAYALDCQADLFRDMRSRFIVPLQYPEPALDVAPRLNPRFEVEGDDVMMITQWATSVMVGELGEKVASLASHDHTIVGALDMLITGV